MTTVIVTQAEYRKGQAVFERSPEFTFVQVPPEEALLAAAIKGANAQYAIVGHNPYIDDLYRALPRGGVLARFGVGHDGIDKLKATAAGILCTNTPGTLDDSVAEHTFALLLALCRNLLPMGTNMRQGVWDQELGLEIRGRKLVVIGTGAIGQRVAAIGAAGFGMTVTVCGRSKHGDQISSTSPGVLFTRSYDEAVQNAVVISLHIPGTKENYHFLDGERLRKLAPGARLINTSRGAVIDEAALYDVLSEGALAGAALDVFTEEPYVPIAIDKDLRTLRNVMMTPHVGSYTVAAVKRMAERAIRNIQAAVEGSYGEMDLLNPAVLQGPN
jgi:lactate dehydrogenase-like 2-hydroxyacid dehydrogenase